ncbi:MAG TPA: class I SAM-dependent methyltransferase [Vicinamibacterales bacterium]|nr:class I SAM-dependent methyltransferase [Vicinamibacterales bacterium]
MISDRLLQLVRCPDCGGRLGGRPPGLVCESCSRPFATDPDFLVLHPGITFAEQTKYLDAALHADARHERVTPPLLGARIRNDVLRSFLAPGPGDAVIDLGCGSGRTLVWNAGLGAYQAGIDVSPYFAREARAQADLVLGDLRRLPFAAGAFTKASALDVFEHLSRDALAGVLAEIARVLAPGGALFVYSHVRKNSRLAGGLRQINRLARWMERRGLVDLSRERLRKSDHLNPLADIPDLESAVAGAGFRIERIRYYTPLVGGFVENILVRAGEHWLAKRAAARVAAGGGGAGRDAAVRDVRAAVKRRAGESGPAYWGLRAVTWIMKIDLVLFGRVRSGPYFALLRHLPAEGGAP